MALCDGIGGNRVDKPRPEDFGISTSALTELAAQAKESEPYETRVWFALWASCSFALFAVLWSNSGICAAAGALLVGAIPIAGVSFGIANLITRNAFPDLARLKAFEREVSKYESWCARQQRDWWFGLTGRQFEREVASLFEKLGNEVELTPASGDGGIDLIVETINETVAVQCKAHRNPVGPAVVRELFGAISADKEYTRGLLVALGGVTSGAGDFAARNRIEVWTVDDVIRQAAKCQYDSGAVQPRERSESIRRSLRSSKQQDKPAKAREGTELQSRPLPSSRGSARSTEPVQTSEVPTTQPTTSPATCVDRVRPQEAIKWKLITSSMIRAVGFRSSDLALFVKFNDGSVYRYQPVSQALALEFMMADSHGKFFHQFIRDSYESVRCDNQA